MNRKERRARAKIGGEKNLPRPDRGGVAPSGEGQQIADAFNAAVAFHQAGNLSAAEGVYRKILDVAPHEPGVLNNLGIALKDQGRAGEAIMAFRRAVACDPSYATAYNNLGLVFTEKKAWHEAAEVFRKAINLEPRFFEACNNLGIALRGLGLPGEAVESYRRALEINPEYAEAHNNLGNALYALGSLDDAARSYRRAMEFDPDDAVFHNNLGNIHKDMGRIEEAVLSYGKALVLQPDYPEALANMGIALYGLGRLEEAEKAYRHALELAPHHADLFNGLGVTLQGQVKLGPAYVALAKAVLMRNDYTQAFSNLLYGLQFATPKSVGGKGLDARQLLAMHRSWDAVYGGDRRKAGPSLVNKRETERKLRVGLLSPDFGCHPVGFFLSGMTGHLDKGLYDVFCYSDRHFEDDITKHIKDSCSYWIPVHGQSDEQLIERIHDDGIDILVDLAGHTANNRLPVFMRRAAPVQVTWAGYVGTTGLSEMDWLIADRFHVPEGEEDCYAENVYRLPDDYVCYAPPANTPEVGPSPSESTGYVTFGCFNELAKVNDSVVALWARILDRVPGSKIFLKTKALADTETTNRIRTSFGRNGIDRDRVILEGPSPHGDLLESYNRVDVALDPFPYSGGLTTLEALWMGVPVVTMPGDTFAGRHSTSHLNNVGLRECVATDAESYADLAASLAEDAAKRAVWRAGLREQMSASPVCDGDRFARNFGAALQTMWRSWCASEEGVDAADEEPKGAGAPLKVAVITPYFEESLDVLRRCHDSVAGQTHSCTHFLVADGRPRPEVDDWGLRHIVLAEGPHGDNGNTPRGRGALAALAEGFDAVALLDADNWYTKDHIERLVDLHQRTGATVCTSGRTIHGDGGKRLPIDPAHDESDGIGFSDTSCLFLTGSALSLLSLWGVMPKALGPYCDRVFWHALRSAMLPRAHDPEPTVGFFTQYARHYAAASLPIPEGSKEAEDMARKMVVDNADDNARNYLRFVFPGLNLA